MNKNKIIGTPRKKQLLSWINYIKIKKLQTFGTPRNHPKSKPFTDHVMSFFYTDQKIWIRHYQISPITESELDLNDPEKQVLTEIGPRLVLDPIRIMDRSFTGQTLYMNPNYNSPCQARRLAKIEQGIQARRRQADKDKKADKYKDQCDPDDELNDIF